MIIEGQTGFVTQGPKPSDSHAYAVIPEWILDSDISAQAVRLFGVLDRYVGQNAEAWPSRKTLAARMNCSTNTVDRAIEELVKIRAITVDSRFREDGSRTSSSYVTWPASERSDPTPTHIRQGGLPASGIAEVTPYEVEEGKPSSSKIHGRVKGFGPDVDRLCALLAERIAANGSKPPTITHQWRVEIDRLIRLDGHSPKQVENMINWCQDDPFWRSNILSATKLRAKYDQMRLKATSESGHPSPTPETVTPLEAEVQLRVEVEQRTAESAPPPPNFAATIREKMMKGPTSE
jgi:hypothetical protein